MTASGQDLSRDQVVGLLTELGATLSRDGLRADLYVVGGAAMALTVDTRRITRDIDAVFLSGTVGLLSAAREIALRHGLNDDWLNDNVKAVLGDPMQPDRDPLEFTVPGLTVAVASPEHLLAMKMIAGRDKDVDDLAALFEHLGITTPEAAVQIVERVFGGREAYTLPPIEAHEILAEDVLDLIRTRNAR